MKSRIRETWHAARRRFDTGAVRPGFLDILTALIVLAILLWASWMQFPAYLNNGGETTSRSTSRG